MAHNAKSGGEIGANGEFYKGGQFVADNPDTVKGARYIENNPRKIEIEPHKWILQAPGAEIAIYQIIKHCARYDEAMHKPVFFIGEDYDEVAARHYKQLHDMYMAGHRTLSLAEFGAMRKAINWAYWIYCPKKTDVRIFANN